MKRCNACGAQVHDTNTVCQACGSNNLVFENNGVQGMPQGNPNSFPQVNVPYGQPQAGNGTKSAKKNPLIRILCSVLGVVIVFVGLFIFDNKKTKDLLGTWTYAESFEYDEAFDVDCQVNFELKEGTFRFYIDEEKTEENLLAFYEEYFDYHGITDEDIIAEYGSKEECLEQILEEDMNWLLDEFNKESNDGTWRIEKGKFFFKYSDSSTEYETEYSVDGDTLELITDGITLTRVSE